MRPAGRSARARSAARRRAAPSHSRSHGARGDLQQLVGLGRKHRRIRRRDERLADAPRRGGEDPAPSGSSSDRTSSSRRSGANAAASAISSASASRSASTARRCSPCDPKLRSSRGRDAMTTSSRCGPRPVDAPFEVAVEPCLERCDRRRHAVVAQLALRQAELRRALGEGGARSCSVSRRAATSCVPSSATCAVHGASASATSGRRRRGQRRVALRDGRAVIRRSCARAGDSRPSDAVEVRAARRRRALDDAEAVRGEDERRGLGAQLLGRAQRRAVQPSRASPHRPRATSSISSGTVTRRPRTATRAAVAPKRISWASLRVRGEKPCVRRAAPRAGSSSRRRSARPRARDPAAARAPAARTTGSYERDARRSVVDDQPGRRIGMTRYVKSSPSPWITAGRSGLISFTRRRRRRATRARRGGSPR